MAMLGKLLCISLNLDFSDGHTQAMFAFSDLSQLSVVLFSESLMIMVK